ncbi:Uncharacterised protein [Shimwellia blattae]|nr:Uncharacterised protein [Shimwellia blattae]VEC23631.1 Uncharacterised protein [Shimwellia blattae]
MNKLCGNFFIVNRYDDTGVVAFRALVYIESDSLTGFECSVTIHLDG